MRTPLLPLAREIDVWYRRLRRGIPREPQAVEAVRRAIDEAMTRFLAEEPEAPAVLIKARLHQEIAERFEPVLFRHAPFFFELGLRPAENWGTPHPTERVAGAWLLGRREGALLQHPRVAELRRLGAYDAKGLGLWKGPLLGFDADHHALGSTRLLSLGVDGLLAEIDARRREPLSAEQAVTLQAMEMSLRAVLRIAERFAVKAEAMLRQEADPVVRRNLERIAATARRIPARPAATFYEGLAMLLLMREVTATLEAIGISVLGHPDRQLIDLYRADLAQGRITEEEAYDLLARWMLPTDMKFHVWDSAWPETSTCINLGGCDADGRTVWNELTRLIIAVHRDNGFMNPKLNCRYAADSPPEYLQLIAETTLAGHNHFSLLNDDVLIPACVGAGKEIAEARLYVNGGCQETICEGVEHSAGAYYYFNMPRVLDLWLSPPTPEALPDEAVAALPWLAKGDGTPDDDGFERFLDHFMAALQETIRVGAAWRTEVGRLWSTAHPCPLFSTTLEGCIAAARDYTEGGARHNPAGVALVGLATLVDSLMAIRYAVFEQGWLTMAELRHCLADDWQGHEALRARIRRLPRYGQGHPEADTLAARLSHELAAAIRELPNERGGRFQPSFFVYYAFSDFGRLVGATPDGRGAGEPLTQGIGPDRHTAVASPTDLLHSLSRIDFREHPANCVLDLQLPAGGALAADKIAALTRTFARLGGPTLQLNCVSADEMRDAQVHPEAHRDLVVRICGLSAYFVSLTHEVQDEIIGRAMVSL